MGFVTGFIVIDYYSATANFIFNVDSAFAQGKQAQFFRSFFSNLLARSARI